MSETTIDYHAAGSHIEPDRLPLGALLIEDGLIDEAQLASALAESTQTGERIGETVVRHGWATEDDIARLLAEQAHLDYLQRASIFFDGEALGRLTREDAQRLEALPTRVRDGQVVVAVSDPTAERLAATAADLGRARDEDLRRIAELTASAAELERARDDDRRRLAELEETLTQRTQVGESVKAKLADLSRTLDDLA